MRSSHQHVERCVNLCRTHGFDAIETAYLPMRALTHMYGLRFAEALEDCRAVVEMVAKGGPPRAEIISLSVTTQIFLEHHDFTQVDEHARRALELVERIGARRFVALFQGAIARIRMHAGDRAGALDILEANLAICRETGITFFGPAMLGAIALASDDPKRREEALREAQTILDRGCVSQNYFRFYRDAIEVSLAVNDWDQADLYATALENYFRDEPMSWPSFIIARGRALSDFGRGRGGEATLSQIKHLRDEAAHLNMLSELTRLEAAFPSTPT